MKNLFKLLAIFTAFAFTSCTTSLNTTAPVDDVYSYGPTKVVVEKPASSPSTNTSTPSADNNSTPVTSAAAVVNPQTTYQDQVVELEGDTYYESSFSEDDYYDYSYAARIKRFHDPLEGVGYYDSYYTNRYWYDYDPYSYGTSIYIGYDYAYPYYRPSVSFGFSWGWGWGWNWNRV
jgi:hypothetical protein